MDRHAKSRLDKRRPAAATAASDEDLMYRFRDGETAAFDELVDRHKRGLFAFLRRSAPTRAEAEDLFQEVFLKVLRAAPSWEAEARFTTWLYTVARNAAIDAARRRKTGPLLVALEGAMGDAAERAAPIDTLSDRTVQPDAAALEREQTDAVEALVAALPADQREVFLLKREGLTFEQIGQVTQTPANTVKSRLRYALARLRSGLEARGLIAPDQAEEGR